VGGGLLLYVRKRFVGKRGVKFCRGGGPGDVKWRLWKRPSCSNKSLRLHRQLVGVLRESGGLEGFEGPGSLVWGRVNSAVREEIGEKCFGRGVKIQNSMRNHL